MKNDNMAPGEQYPPRGGSGVQDEARHTESLLRDLPGVGRIVRFVTDELQERPAIVVQDTLNGVRCGTLLLRVFLSPMDRMSDGGKSLDLTGFFPYSNVDKPRTWHA